MSKIATAFEKGNAFIPFVTCGDPTIETTEAVVRSMVVAGADLIELGIPFSDPTAEGPVIQEASTRALAGGVTTDKIFDMVARLRADIDTPFAFMTYANVVFSYGIERFAARAEEVGIDGLILPDVPFEEREEFAPAFAAHGIDLIAMIAPTSEDRVAMIAEEASGFIYLVSSLGVTGVRSQITTDLEGIVVTIRKVTDVPVAVGFGISTPDVAAHMAHLADGAIVGSAIVKIVGAEGAQAAGAVGDYVRAMAEAVHTA